MKLHTRLFLSFGVIFLAGGVSFAVEAILVKDPYLLGAGGIAAAIVILLGFSWAGRGISRWLDSTDARAAKRAPRAKEMTAALPLLSRDMEMTGGALERTFDEFVRLVAGQSEGIGAIVSATEEQKTAVKNASAVIEETVRSLDSISTNIENQSAAVSQLSSTIEEMTASIKSIAAVGRKAGELAKNLSQKAHSGGTAVSGTIDAIQSVRGFSEQIAEIVTMITDIAGRTNLLSMNAAIEAAHAGDAGKGFAVVAGEIRKLAENATESAEQISRLVKSVVRTINEAFDTGAQAVDRFGEIREDVEQTKSVVTEISGATEEQTRGTDEILKATSSLVAVSEGMRDAVARQRAANQEAGRAVRGLEAIAARAGEIARKAQSNRFPMLEAVGRLGRISARVWEAARRIGRPGLKRGRS